MSLFNELKRRNVIRVAAAYVVVAWLLIQVAETIFPLFGFDDTPARLVVVVLAVGFIPALVFAWAFEFTPQGLKRDADVVGDHSLARASNKKLDRAILVVLALAVAYFGFDKFVLDPARDQANVETARQEGRSEALIQSYGDRSIAVLPFVDMSAGGDQEYMSDGIAEELLNLLARIPDLRVISRSSAFAFKGKDIDIPSVAQKLNVKYVLEGSVRTAGEQLRITAQLIEAGSDTHLWSQTYDRNLENIFDIQDEISASIIDALKVKLLGGNQSLDPARSANLDAYNAFLIGAERLSLRTREDIEAARAQFEKAIELDPEFAAAYVQLAHAELLLEHRAYGGRGSESEESDTNIAAHLEKALTLTPDLPEAHGVQGYYHLRRHRYAEAREALDRAISLNPNYALAYNWRADAAIEQDRFLDMLADREKAYSLDPMSLQISADLADEYRDFWRPKDADRMINRMFDLHPDHPLAYQAASINLGKHGRSAEALFMTERAIAAHPDDPSFKNGQATSFYFMGFFEELAALNIDHYIFLAALIEGRHEDAKGLLDKNQEVNPGSWLNNERMYYRVAGGEGHLEKISAVIEQQIASLERRNLSWRDYCSINLVYDLRQTNTRGDAIEDLMAACHNEFEERLKAGYLCPCEWGPLVFYTILDGRIEEAVHRAEQWMDSGWSQPDLAIHPIFKLLSDRPEYQEILARNAEQMARQRQIYLASR